MDLVLDKKVDHRKHGTKESEAKEFPVLLSLAILRGGGDGTKDMRDRADQIEDHGDIMDIVVIR